MTASGLRPVPADLCRLAALVSLAVGTWHGGFVGFALFLLVLGATVLPRALELRPLPDVVFCLAVLAGAWAAQLDWYVTVPGLDLVAHVAVTGLVAWVTWMVLVRLGVLPSGLPPATRFVLVLGLGATLAVLWELGEWFGHTYLDDAIQVGYLDTLGDLAAGLLGSAAAGWAARERP